MGLQADDLIIKPTQPCLPVQAVAVDLLYFHDALHECSLRAVGMAALGGAFPPELGARAVDVIAARAAAGAVPPAQWHSLLAALLLGSMSGGEHTTVWQRLTHPAMARQLPSWGACPTLGHAAETQPESASLRKLRQQAASRLKAQA